MGRFINRDPIEEKGGLNLYAYCNNNAINYYDILGMYTMGSYAQPDIGSCEIDPWGLTHDDQADPPEAPETGDGTEGKGKKNQTKKMSIRMARLTSQMRQTQASHNRFVKNLQTLANNLTASPTELSETKDSKTQESEKGGQADPATAQNAQNSKQLNTTPTQVPEGGDAGRQNDTPSTSDSSNPPLYEPNITDAQREQARRFKGEDGLWLQTGEAHNTWGPIASRWAGSIEYTFEIIIATGSMAQPTSVDSMTAMSVGTMIAEYEFEVKAHYNVYDNDGKFLKYETKTESRYVHKEIKNTVIPLAPAKGMTKPNTRKYNYIVPKWEGNPTPHKEWKRYEDLPFYQEYKRQSVEKVRRANMR